MPRRVLDLESEVVRGSGSIPTGGNILFSCSKSLWCQYCNYCQLRLLFEKPESCNCYNSCESHHVHVKNTSMVNPVSVLTDTEQRQIQTYKFNLQQRSRRRLYKRELIDKYCNYRPQTKFAKVMFLHLSVSHSVHRGGLPQCMLGYHPPGTRHPPEQTPPGPGIPPADPLGPGNPLQTRHPPAQSMLGDTVKKRAVCILLECVLV